MPAVNPSVVVADFDTELVVLVPERRKAHLLEPIWALLFDSCRAADARERFADELADATGWSAGEVEGWLYQALAELQRNGVVVG